MPFPIALTIAGSDSSGGAGVQADLKTFSALSVYGASVLTALTAQSTRAVTAIHEVPEAFVRAQLDAVLRDLDVAAVKIGMLGRAEVVKTVAEALRHHGAQPVVLDPVMVAKSGARLLAEEALSALRKELIPLCAVLTPNLPEAAALLDASMGDVLADPRGACARLSSLGARAVLLKGGHAGGPRSDDLFHDEAGYLELSFERVLTRNTHGTGCTLAAAIAAFLARGLTPREAVREARSFVQGAIAGADQLRVGHGHGPVHHFYKLWI